MSAGRRRRSAGQVRGTGPWNCFEYFAGPARYALPGRGPGGRRLSEIQPLHVAAHPRGARLGRDGRDGHAVRRGRPALLVGTSYIDGDEVVAAARPTLDRLSDDTTETIHLARLDGTNVVYLATRQSQHYLRPFARVGHRLPRTRPRSARRCYATHTDEQVRKMLPDAPRADRAHYHRPGEAFIEELHQVREQGFAVDREENTLGLRCFGVAIPYRTTGTRSAARSRWPGSPPRTNRWSRTPCSTLATG